MSQPNINPYLKDWSTPVFNGEVYEDVEMWISTIRYGLKQRRVPQEHWVSVAFHFMGYEPRAVLDDVKQTMRDLQGSEWDWNWTRLTNGLIHIQNQAKKEAADSSGSVGSVGDSLRRFRKEHPYAAAAAGVGLITVGGITVAPAMLVGTLNLLGFSASGVVGGSIAASIQSAVYGGAIASGSAFSMAQSAAAGGILVAVRPNPSSQCGCDGTGSLDVWKGEIQGPA
ncbi:hypothetical protein B0H11DRAFT_1909267 [Mycena galericulata]|nr:hypothetical protein B0H11DRAFT_1909267 [Mycena galericulata]